MVHRILITGDGKVIPSHVVGGGSFVHSDNASPVPKTIFSSGTWKAKRLLSFKPIGGAYGDFAAGVFEMEVELIQEIPSPAVIPATLQFVSNIEPAGLSTGQNEGVTLTIPDAPFGPFKPFISGRHFPLFTTGVEEVKADNVFFN